MPKRLQHYIRQALACLLYIALGLKNALAQNMTIDAASKAQDPASRLTPATGSQAPAPLPFTKKRYDDFTWVYTLEVDPSLFEIVAVRAADLPAATPARARSPGLATVAHLAQHYGALAAINGGFWQPNGRPAGILKIRGQWQGRASKPRAAIGWRDGGKQVRIDRVLTRQQEPKGDGPAFSVELTQRGANSSRHDEWQNFEYIVGGAPQLITAGALIDDYTSERTLKSFLEKKYARTAIGIKPNGNWLFVVADPSFFGAIGGLSVAELAELLLAMGCEEALNLDGGSSSTLVVADQVVNDPTGDVLEQGKIVRAVGDAILILPRR